MNKFSAGFMVLALLASSNVYAAVYDYTGPNFDTVNGAYTTSMRVTGSFSTSSPIPPNSVDFDAKGIVTSWSFSDGLQTIDDSNGVIYPASFTFTTDGSGNVTAAEIAVVNSPLATAVGQKNDVIAIFSSNLEPEDFAGVQAICTEITDGICTGFDQPENIAFAEGAGEWTLAGVEAAESIPIPTLSTWGIVTFILLLGTFVFARRRQIRWR